MKHRILLCFLIFAAIDINSQGLPSEMVLENGVMSFGKKNVEGLYDPKLVQKIELEFPESNWFELLNGAGGPFTEGQELIGKLIYNDELILDSVVVGIKGLTSDFANDSEKKSFSVDIDTYIDQDLLGYDNLNLNGGFEDPTSMHELLYYDRCRPFVPALKAALIDLYVNGEYWGPYSNVQQIEGEYIKEWFSNNDGTRWRAIQPNLFTAPPPPMGNIFGAGRSTLNYNGPDSLDYNEDYTLKKSKQEDPWADLILACEAINNLPLDDNYFDSLTNYVDVDRALWFLIQEILYCDDDSYVYKGGMDYYVYWDAYSQRLLPMESDGNSILNPINDFGPFFRSFDSDFPLMEKWMNVMEIRQRYLAHLRVVLEDFFDTEDMHASIDAFAALLDERVQNDPKALFTYSEFLNGIEDVKDFVEQRRQDYINHGEINKADLEFGQKFYTSNNGLNLPPDQQEDVLVEVEILEQAQLGVDKVVLYYGTGIMGKMQKVEMEDLDGDLTFEAQIPGQPANTWVRYYFEAIADDATSTVSFLPKGAEHDLFYYRVNAGNFVQGEVRINEIMASNKTWVQDEFDEYDDWIELYNTSSSAIDISGYHLTDNVEDAFKWALPQGTVIGPDEYFIIWADGQQEQGQYHAGFKLSAEGEEIYLMDVAGNISDQVLYGAQNSDDGFARIPNGVGEFIAKVPTFGFNNEETSHVEETLPLGMTIYPNPTSSLLYIKSDADKKIDFELHNAIGQLLTKGTFRNFTILNVEAFNAGVYWIKTSEGVVKFIKS